MERQIPKNVRQIGNVSDSPKIYVEDYVDTFFTQLCEKCEKAGNGPVGAFLVGDIQSGDDGEFVYIYGAIQMHELKMNGNEYVIDESTWKHAYEDCKQFFEDGHLYHKVLRHGFARCLIVRVHFMAESGLVYVESNNEISWFFVLKDFKEQLDKAEDPVGRKPVLGGKNRHCIVCAV